MVSVVGGLFVKLLQEEGGVCVPGDHEWEDGASLEGGTAQLIHVQKTLRHQPIAPHLHTATEKGGGEIDLLDAVVLRHT